MCFCVCVSMFANVCFSNVSLVSEDKVSQEIYSIQFIYS